MEIEILSIKLDEEWTAERFGHLFLEVEAIGKIVRLCLDGPSPPMYSQLFGTADDMKVNIDRELGSSPPVFLVKKVEFASPGHADLLGVGKIVEQVRIFITDIIDRTLGSEKRRLERTSLMLDIDTKRIANAERILKLAEKLKLPEDQKAKIIDRLLFSESVLSHRVSEKQITGLAWEKGEYDVEDDDDFGDE